MIVRHLVLAACCALFAQVSQAIPQAPAVPEQAGLVEHPCWFAVDDDTVRASCYWMFVHESAGSPDSPIIGFPVIRLSRGPNDLPPVLHLGGGGPGNAMPLAAEQINATWQNHQYMSLEAGMDLILMDPRGVGHAMPRLSCHEWLGTVRDTWRQPLSLQREWNIGLEADQRCIRRLKASGINLAMYNSAAVARDVEALRKALGVRQWNLYGVSYGSRYALTIARDFPHSVSRMVLDGVVFPNLRYEEQGARTSEQAIARAFAWCEADARCRADFPDSQERFWALAESLNDKPLALTVTDPETFRQLPVALTGYRLFAVFFHAAYNEMNHGQFPSLVRSLEYGNTDLIAPFVRQYLGYLLDPADSDAALATHYCYEEYPFVDNGRLLAAARGYRAVIRDPLLLNVSTTREWCGAWLEGVTGPAREGEAIRTDIPTLVLHGALDPVLPVEDIEAQLSTFENVELLTYPDIAHDVVSASLCAEMAAGEFYRAGLDSVSAASCNE
jgi:pimeloyl-ACP methyl ester carboxylesterase